MRSRASPRSSAPPSASVCCYGVRAMKHKWPSTMSIRPSSISNPKPTCAPISIIRRMPTWEGASSNLQKRCSRMTFWRLLQRSSDSRREGPLFPRRDAQDLFHRAHQARLLADIVELFQDGDRFSDRRDRPNSEPLRAGGNITQLAVPDEDHLGVRFDRDVQAILRTIVDERIELQGVGNLASRALDDEHERVLEAMCFEPPL